MFLKPQFCAVFNLMLSVKDAALKSLTILANYFG